MSFTTPCFIRTNTPELRKQLEELGYHQASSTPFDFLGTLPSLEEYVTIPMMSTPRSIYCGTNEPLFLAIAALRDDSDYMQWFTDGDNWILCTMRNIGEYWSTHECTMSLDTIHKATVEELINHNRMNYENN